MLLTVLGWIIFGLIVGLIAKAIMPGRDPGGFIVTILLGIVGAIIGGFIGNALATGDAGPGRFISFILAVIGAIVVLAVYRLLTGRSLRA